MQDKRITPILKLEGSMGPIELLIYHTEDLKIIKSKISTKDLESLLN
jgi:hypothetical protein